MYIATVIHVPHVILQILFLQHLLLHVASCPSNLYIWYSPHATSHSLASAHEQRLEVVRVHATSYIKCSPTFSTCSPTTISSAHSIVV